MKKEFRGKYFNGLSSKPYPCEVWLGGYTFTINVYDEEGNVSDVVSWDVTKISKNDIEISDKIRLKYGSFPHQSLEVQDAEFQQAVNQMYRGQSFSKRDWASVMSRKWKWVALMFVALVAFSVFSFEVIIPNMAEYAATKVPLEMEEAIGVSAYEQIASFASEDTIQSLLVGDFFEAMNIEHSYDYTVTVLDSKVQNAFAVPGGHIAIYSGIIDDMESPEELAALLAHESSHVELKHSLKSIFRSLSGYFVISLLFGDTGGVSAVVFQNISMFRDLQYSRDMEREADMRGLQCMQDAGINPDGMVRLFEAIDKHQHGMVGDERASASEFMSTHPLTSHRIEYIKEYIANDKHEYKANPKLERLFKRIKKAGAAKVEE